MGITVDDILFKYTGTAGTTDPETSLGGSISLDTIPSGTDNNLFDDVTGDESSLGAQHYRAIGINNTLSTHIWMNTKAYILGYERAGANFDLIYFAPEQPAGTGGEPDGTIQIIASETDAPTGVTWTVEGTPSDTVDVSGKDYGNSIGADDWAGMWIQRSIPSGADAYSDRSCTLRVEGETSASPYIYHVVVDFRLSWYEGKFSMEKVFEDKSIIATTED